jgi:PPOX class probable F420-dependent enzyme
MALSEGILDWLADRHHGVLVTLRADRSPQSSNIAFAVHEGVALVSVTDDRAKTRNLRRDPRGILHVNGDNVWSYASIQFRADVGPISTEPGDAVGKELLQLFEQVAGKPHPDPQEFFEAMVTDKRLVLRLELLSAVGQGLPD